mmetsp:Transcript_15676/g.15806  ORF Transcript_15676/g.15806 Transcript_15676/m.15806 type:complete len:307 (-) Transcript_15676:112-1032(-)
MLQILLITIVLIMPMRLSCFSTNFALKSLGRSKYISENCCYFTICKSSYGTDRISHFRRYSRNLEDEDELVISANDEFDNTTPIKEKFKKVRQHVNPLASRFQIPIKLTPDWMQRSFKNPCLPLYLDIGCSKGTWAMHMGSNHTDVNYLGLEIRRPVVEECLRRRDMSGLSNVHFMYANANIDLDNIMETAQHVCDIKGVTIHFPDPHFKKRHKKRRVLTPTLVDILADRLSPNSYVFIQSDILDVMEDMLSHLQAHSYFSLAPNYHLNLLTHNPPLTSVQTEREIATIAKNMPVYRMKFIRISVK